MVLTMEELTLAWMQKNYEAIWLHSRQCVLDMAKMQQAMDVALMELDKLKERLND